MKVPDTLTLKEALGKVEQMTEVCDAKGVLVGYVVPPRLGDQLQREHQALYARADGLFSEEELEEARNDTTEYTMADVMKLLEQP